MKPSIFIFSIALFCVVCSAGCEKYNYSNAFGIDKYILSKAKNVDGAEGKMIKLTSIEFDKMKPSLAKAGFNNWFPVDIYYGITSKKFQIKGKGDGGIIFSVKKRNFGWFKLCNCL